MGDSKILDTNQIVNGLAVLLSFFVGYKYAIKRQEIENEKKNMHQGACASRDMEEPVAFV